MRLKAQLLSTLQHHLVEQQASIFVEAHAQRADSYDPSPTETQRGA